MTPDTFREEASPSVNHRATLALLQERLAAIRTRIADACARAGRGAEEVRLVAVTKGVAPEVVALAAKAGVSDFGENYAQDLPGKRAAAPEARWHFIGRLQRNKIPLVAEHAHVVQTLEPGRAADRLAERPELDRLDCLAEVDFTGRRVGIAPEEVEAFVGEAETRGFRIRGLMTIAPLDQDPARAFGALRTLRDRLRERAPRITELSMGMSADLEVGVEQGATMVRVGTSIFGPRKRR